MKQLTLRWHGHACFALTCDGYTVVFDPYEDNYVPGLSPLDVTGDLVLCSHGHGDHNAAGLVKPGQGGENPFRITKIDTYHDPEQGRLRGENTIHVLQTGDLRLAHFGDIGCPLTPAQPAELEGLDGGLIPVGRVYTLGPQEGKELMDTIRPKIVIPMHYRKGEVGLTAVGPVEDFLALVGDYVYYPGDTITVNAGTEPQVAVLTYQG